MARYARNQLPIFTIAEILSFKMATCDACQRLLPGDAYDRDRARPTGHRRVCRACRTKRRQAAKIAAQGGLVMPNGRSP
jgi:hypothetical protein